MQLLQLEEAVTLIHGHLPFVPSHIPDRDLPLVGHGIVPILHLLRVVSVALPTCPLLQDLHVKVACDNGVLIGIVLCSYLLEVRQEKGIIHLFL